MSERRRVVWPLFGFHYSPRTAARSDHFGMRHVTYCDRYGFQGWTSRRAFHHWRATRGKGVSIEGTEWIR